MMNLNQMNLFLTKTKDIFVYEYDLDVKTIEN